MILYLPPTHAERPAYSSQLSILSALSSTYDDGGESHCWAGPGGDGEYYDDEEAQSDGEWETDEEDEVAADPAAAEAAAQLEQVDPPPPHSRPRTLVQGLDDQLTTGFSYEGLPRLGSGS
jgi:hypothetical protein